MFKNKFPRAHRVHPIDTLSTLVHPISPSSRNRTMKVTGRSHRSSVLLSRHQAALMTAVSPCFFFLCSSLKTPVRMGPRPLRCATRSSSSTVSSSCASISPTRSCSSSSTTTCSSSSKRSTSARALNGHLLTSAWISSRLSI